MTGRLLQIFVVAFSICLLLGTHSDSSFAQATGGGGGDPQETDPTCNPAIQEWAETRSQELQEEAAARNSQRFQILPPSAEMVCLDQQLASSSNTIGGIFSDNPDFFNSVKNTITLPGNISNSVLTSLASVIGGNPLSSGGIGNLIGGAGGLVGFQMPTQCNGMQTLFENEAQRAVDIASAASPIDIGFIFGGGAFSGISFGGSGSQESLGTEVPDNRVPDGECRKYVQFEATENSRELGGCYRGKGATCVVEYSGNTFTCNAQ